MQQSNTHGHRLATIAIGSATALVAAGTPVLASATPAATTITAAPTASSSASAVQAAGLGRAVQSRAAYGTATLGQAHATVAKPALLIKKKKKRGRTSRRS